MRLIKKMESSASENLPEIKKCQKRSRQCLNLSSDSSSVQSKVNIVEHLSLNANISYIHHISWATPENKMCRQAFIMIPFEVFSWEDASDNHFFSSRQIKRLSIIWRASINHSHTAAKVNTGDSSNDVLRGRDPVTLQAVACVASVITDTELFCSLCPL